MGTAFFSSSFQPIISILLLMSASTLSSSTTVPYTTILHTTSTPGSRFSLQLSDKFYTQGLRLTKTSFRLAQRSIFQFPPHLLISKFHFIFCLLLCWEYVYFSTPSLLFLYFYFLTIFFHLELFLRIMLRIRHIAHRNKRHVEQIHDRLWTQQGFNDQILLIFTHGVRAVAFDNNEYYLSWLGVSVSSMLGEEGRAQLCYRASSSSASFDYFS